MKAKTFFISTVIVILMGFLLVSFTISPKNDYVAIQKKKWVAPKSADDIVNPLKNDANAAASGKKLFKAMCAVCHGVKGKGDGMAGAGLSPKPSNFTTKEFQSQTDGAIFWKLTEGRSPMASYKESIPETKRWQIVNYLRTLKK